MADLDLRTRALPVGAYGRRASGWFGVWCLVTTEAAIFAYLIFSYFYLAAQSPGAWPPGGLPSLRLAAPNTLILLLSSAALIWAERSGARRAHRARLLGGIAIAFLLGVVFVGVQLREWQTKAFSLHSGVYGSIYFTLTGFHLIHVIIGLLLLLTLLTWASLGYFSRERHAPLTIGAIYWHFVDVIWLLVFAAVYVTPRMR
jgi:heme/copper-type cytochrome/quinol oxidase subunit 3